jgi:LmbE family N-acetylglucosaminyl deacetylase
LVLKLRADALAADATTILCVGAHSDDIEIGCGGTVLTLLSRRPELSVHWVVLSSTDERRREALRGAERFLGDSRRHHVAVQEFEERYFPYDTALKRYFDDLGASLSPDLIFTHCRHDLHQDHRVVSELTWNTFRDHLILEYEVPKYDADLAQPGFFVELPRSECERKVGSIIDTFPSQRSRYWFSDETFWALLRLRGVECRSATGYAEAFHARKLVLA